MRNFNEVYKEKVNENEQLHETKIVGDFRRIYNALLEHYNLTAIHDLNEKSQLAFLTELNQYWSEEKGLNEEGEAFLEERSLRLTENSTPLQKKTFLKSKTTVLLNETMRQNDVKFKVYSIIDEMYNQVKGGSLEDVLSPNMISDILTEAMAESLDDLITNIRHELNESTKPKEKLNESKKPKVYLKKKLNESELIQLNNKNIKEVLQTNAPVLLITTPEKAKEISTALMDRAEVYQLPGKNNFGEDIQTLDNETAMSVLKNKSADRPTLILTSAENKNTQALMDRIKVFKY
jgi:hypothetical protein